MDFPICKREAEVAKTQALVKTQALAKTLTNQEAQVIVNARGDIARRKLNRAKERDLACACDNTNPGLQDLLLFIESDFEVVQEELLAGANASERATAQQRYRTTLSSCQSREQEIHLNLLQESQLAYEENPGNDPKLAVMAENSYGLRGFIRESADGRTKTFAFAGSQTLFDWNCNVNPLENKCSKQLKLALDRYLPAAVAWVKSGKNIQCTGHSLGGAMAEGFCAAVMRHVRKDTENFPDFGDFSKDNRIKIVTFNALGASESFRHAIAKYENGINAKAVPVPVGPNSWLNTNTLHYRVEGDPLALVAKTSHLMGTVFEKPATRRVQRSGSKELSALRNMASVVSDGVGDLWRQLTGGRPDGDATIVGPEFCEASKDPLGAHDLASCREIVQSSGGWVESETARVDIPAQNY